MRFLLKTKLIAPRLCGNEIIREDLLEKFNRGYDKNASIYLLAAPPGYGKTLLVTQWLQRKKVGYCWLSLDVNDNNPLQFINYMVNALKSADCTIGESMNGLLDGPVIPNYELIMMNLINEMIDVGKEIVFVIDDIHVISNEFIYDCLNFLISNIPNNLKLVLISRENPPIEFVKLRAKGSIVELRENNLRFNNIEIKQFLKNIFDLNLSSYTIKRIQIKTEGWPVVVQLIGLAISTNREYNLDKYVETILSSNKDIIQYLTNEILNHLEEKHKRFLFQTAQLSRFDKSLCEYISGNPETESIIKDLDKVNLLITSIEDNKEWYRYHHLISEVLKYNIVDVNEQINVHKKASLWFEEKNLFIDAIDQSLMIKDLNRVESLLLKNTEKLFEAGEFIALNRYLNEFKDEHIEKKLHLLSYKAWLLFLIGNTSECMKYANMLNQSNDLIKGTLPYAVNLLLRAVLISKINDTGAIKLAKQALVLINEESSHFRIGALCAIGVTQSITYQYDEAMLTFTEGLKIANEKRLPLWIMTMIYNMSYILINTGRRTEAIEVCQKYIRTFTDVWGKLQPIAILLYLPLGIAYFESGDYQKSKEMLMKAYEFIVQSKIIYFRGHLEYRLVKIFLMEGNHKEAAKILEETFKSADKAEHEWLILMMQTVQLEKLISEDNLIEARKYLHEMNYSKYIELEVDVKSLLVYSFLLLKDKNYEKAASLLVIIEEKINDTKQKALFPELCIYKAICYRSMGKTDIAIDAIRSGLEFCQKEHYFTAFIEKYDMIEDLVHEVKHEYLFVIEKIEQVQLNFDMKNIDKEQVDREVGAININKAVNSLSYREKQVLFLVAKGLSNEEIASKLFITIGTAKWHVNNVFKKLKVNNRAQAIIITNKVNFSYLFGSDLKELL